MRALSWLVFCIGMCVALSALKVSLLPGGMAEAYHLFRVSLALLVVFAVIEVARTVRGRR